ncbi:MAG: DNA helicase UvrD [SAR324 cluster bacterium]|uniref:DNA 3'-5' helicase n=1 Tax=SAR324 cluster bacterium TaxID=2024889 RepID=A0A2D6YJH3_9DELT|nr:DNA helicase UvrD [SAR324 cluster bacterium]
MDLSHLNHQQRQAVTSTKGPILVLAGAGSGKTRVIIQRISWLIQVEQVLPAEILAVTFTNKAAREMQERLKDELRGRQKGVQLSTFHSLGVQLLREHIDQLGYRSNFVIYDTQDQQSVIKGIMEDHDLEDSGLIDAKGVHYEIGQAKNRGLGPDHFLQQRDSTRKTQVGQVFTEYQRVLKGCNAIDFDDILLLTLKLFEEYSEAMDPLRERYHYLMVDEYQDTNRVQYQLMCHLCQRHHNLCVVGDDDQSIYGWRGADIRNILDFERDFPEAKIIRLEQNYRSTPTILKAANQVISQNPQRMPKELWSQKPTGVPLEWIEGKDEAEELELVARQIKIQVLRHGRSHSDYAILFRSNFQSRLIEETLRDSGIPYQIIGSTSFYERKEVKDALAYLRVIHNHSDEVSLHRIINYPRRGIGKTSLIQANYYCQLLRKPLFEICKQARQHSRIPTEAAMSMESFAQMILRYQQRFQQETLGEVLRDLLADVGLIYDLETQKIDPKTKEKRVGFVMELMRGLDRFVEQNPEKHLRDYLERVMLFTQNDREEELVSNQVTLMTLHSAKGLEFPFVFLVGMAEGVFPNQRSLDESGEEEERRLCYVGMTRAREELTMSMARRRKRYREEVSQTMSRFLSDIDSSLFKVAPGAKMDMGQKALQKKQSRADFFQQLRRLQ